MRRGKVNKRNRWETAQNGYLHKEKNFLNNLTYVLQ